MKTNSYKLSELIDWNDHIQYDGYSCFNHERIKENIRNNIDYINSYPEGYLVPDKSGKGYVCPICGSGTGKHGTGLTRGKGKYKNVYTCWSCKCRGDKSNFDIITLIQLEEGLTDRWEAVKRAFEIYGLDY